jgi:hypothetical protein
MNRNEEGKDSLSICSPLWSMILQSDLTAAGSVQSSPVSAHGISERRLRFQLCLGLVSYIFSLHLTSQYPSLNGGGGAI